MKTQRTISAIGLALVKRFEGLRLTAYQDCAGVWTIGYGHTGTNVQADLAITGSQAEELLMRDLHSAEVCVSQAVQAELTQGQFDALVDFCFNLGPRRLLSSTLLRYVNAGNMHGAATQFGMWVHAGGKVQPGLVARRRAEAELFAST